MLNKLKSRRGDIGPGMVVILLLTMMLITLVITLLPLYSHKQTLDTAATEIARYIEIKGAINDDVYEYMDEIRDTIHLDFDFAADADYTGASQQIQLEDKFNITLTYDTKFGIGGMMSIPVTITSRAYGISEKYRK